MLRVLASAFLAAGLAVLPACKSSGTAPNPPSGVAARASHIVIGDIEYASLVTFPATANGSVTPTHDITGAGTGISYPYDIFVDKAAGTVWASNYDGGSDGTITEYSLTATGDTAPTITIGPNGSTTLRGPTGIYVESNGTIIVADYNADTIDFFAPGSNGSAVAPTKQITGLSYPESLWLDSRGNIWVANDGANDIVEYANSATGAAAPMATIGGPATGVKYDTGLYVDSHDNIWVVNCTDDASTASIEEFAAGSNGSVAPERTIEGSNTNQDCPYGVAVDDAGYIYEADLYDSVNVFAPTANGNVAPVQQIPANSTTGLYYPSGIGIY